MNHKLASGISEKAYDTFDSLQIIMGISHDTDHLESILLKFYNSFLSLIQENRTKEKK